MKKSLFIDFEGIDGSGKSTQVKMFADYLVSLNKYNHVLITREPYKDVSIRKILRENIDPYTHALELAKKFVEDRKRHVKELIKPSLEKGVYVVCDRYSFSTLAYQQTQGISLKELLKMHKGLPIPDLIFLIDIPVEVALERMKKDLKTSKRKEEQKFEKDASFLEKLRKNYLDLVNLEKHKVFVIDGTKSKEEVFEEIKRIFEKFYLK